VTYCVVVLLERQPSDEDLVRSMSVAGPQHGVRAVSGGAVLQLCDRAGAPVVSVEAPLYVQVPGEVARLLGPGAKDVKAPVWWLAIHAPVRSGAAGLARSYAEHLVARLGGSVWYADSRPG
jgi:hypothetical protein